MHSGTTDPRELSREIQNRRLSRSAAAEGIVLLKNDGVLPLKKEERVALLGSGAARTIIGGTGSGSVNVRSFVSIYEGMTAAGFSITSGGWLDDFEGRYQKARQTWKAKILSDAETVENPFDAYAANPFQMPEGRNLNLSDLAGAGAAVYVISRIAGEGKDRKLEKGDYYLAASEERDLAFLESIAIPTVLVVNSGGPVELTDVLSLRCVQAVLYISQPGQEGGNAVADILSGAATPSGKLACTWARRFSDYPQWKREYDPVSGKIIKDYYIDGIYVGYRWFDSFDIAPLFPFGHGLSYTSFSVQCQGVRAGGGTAAITVQVKNTGTEFAGKEVVQIYAACPEKLMRERRRLVGFQKTDLLSPGEQQTLEIRIDQMELASFSEAEHAWILEEGRYALYIGNDVDTDDPCGVLWVEHDAVLRRTDTICPTPEALDELSGSCQLDPLPEYFLPVSFIPMPEKKPPAPQKNPNGLAATLPIHDLIPLLYGNIVPGGSAFGSAGVRVPGSAGETTRALEESHGVPSLIMADGPAGLRLRQSYQVDRKTDTVYPVDLLGFFEGGTLVEEEKHDNADTYYQYCTAFPVGTLLAQTWNTKLVWEVGKAIATELEEFGVQFWLAPGMNIQRNPLCGRNFEYYSEDPMLSGKIAAAMVSGVQGSGKAGAVVKHFACNNQEDNRMGVNAVVSERALREIYLRGFEIVIRDAQPAAMMTSYNLLNGVHTANSFDLCTTFARGECGFQGLIMSDWTTTLPEGGSIPWKCIAAGNDLIMPGSILDSEDIRKALAAGFLLEQNVRESAGRVLLSIERLTK